MFSRAAVGLIEFAAAVFLCALIIVLTYAVFIRANTDFDMEAEIKKGNAAVGVLVAAILLSASMILKQGMAPVLSLFRFYALAPEACGISIGKLLAIGAGHLAISMTAALLTVSVVLRFFGRLRKTMQAGVELKNGNLAVGLVLAGVVLTAALYLAEGTGALARALPTCAEPLKFDSLSTRSPCIMGVLSTIIKMCS